MTDIDRRTHPATDQTSGSAAALQGRSTLPAPGEIQFLTDPISLKVVATIGVAWIAAFAWLSSISPDPVGEPSTFDMVAQSAMFVSWMAVFAGLITRQRFVFKASIVGGFLLSGAALLCLATGHTGLWIPSQTVAGLGLAGLGYGASRIS